MNLVKNATTKFLFLIALVFAGPAFADIVQPLSWNPVTSSFNVLTKQGGNKRFKESDSGLFVSVASVPVGLDSTPTCAEAGKWQRTGTIVTYGFRCSVDPTAGNTVLTYRVTVPEMTANFASSNGAYGICVTDIGAAANTAPTVWHIQSTTGQRLISMETNQSTTTAARSVICHVTYSSIGQ